MLEAAHLPRILRFGVFEVDFRAGELRKGGLKVRLQARPLQILAILLEQPGEVITREELRKRLWAADTFVDFDHGLNTAINKLREALGDSAEYPRFIETLPRHGYRFIFPLSGPISEDVTRPPTLVKPEKAELALEHPTNFGCDTPARLSAKVEKEDLSSQPGVEHPQQLSTAAPVVAMRKTRRLYAVGLAGILLVLAVVLAFAYFPTSPAPVQEVRSSVLPPPGISYVFEPETGGPVISPDGRLLVFKARDSSGKEKLWVRPLDSFTGEPIAGTEEASFPFWSPDSRTIGFFVPGKLKKIDVSGGPPQVICDAQDGRGGTWNAQGVIVFSPNGTSGFEQVPATGGTPTPFLHLERTLEHHAECWPAFLPDGRHFLYYWGGSPGEPGEAASRSGVYVENLEGQGRKFLLASNSNALYSPPGYLLFLRRGILMGQRFDARRLRLMGGAFPIAGRVANPAWWHLGRFSVSQTGLLVYREARDEQTQVVWLDANGKQIGTVGEPANIVWARLSPNGKTLAEIVHDSQSHEASIWLVDLSSGGRTRFTFEPGVNMHAIWSPDGKHVVFGSTRNGRRNLYIKNSNGAGKAKPLLTSGAPFLPIDWSRDGRFIAFDQRGQNGTFDLWVLPLTGDRKSFPLIHSPSDEPFGRFSPDGRWFAYQSDESGRTEVYIAPFPGPGGKWQVSSAGGFEPHWRSDGKGLYYLAPEIRMMEVRVTATGSAIEIGRPQELFQLRSMWDYSVVEGGKRFLVVESERGASQKLTLVTNWTANLKR